MKTKLSLSSLFLAGLVFSLAAGAATPGARASNSAVVSATQVEQAQQNAERQNRLNFLLAPIKSQKDLTRYLSSHAHTKTPLDDLSPTARARFLKMLVFSDRGLASFDYKDLENELTPTQIYQVLSLFGAQGATAEMSRAKVRSETDRLLLSQVPTLKCLKDKKCVSRATCSMSNFDCCNLANC